MRASPSWLCCWPGLPQLWLRGDWSAVVIAVAFGGALNLLLVSSVVRPEWLPSSARTLLGISFGVAWSVAAIRGYRLLPELLKPAASVEHLGLFQQAQGEYLRGHWFEAEALLSKLLRFSQRDVDARLMLVSLYRHTRRFEEAASQLRELQQLEGADKWYWEMASERKLLAQAQQDSAQSAHGVP